MKRQVSTKKAPAAVGPYSQAIAAGGFLFCSGQLPIDPATGGLVSGGIEAETSRCLQNLSEVLAAGGASMEDVVKTTVYLADMADFAAVNRVYEGFFPSPSPARAAVGVAALPKGARVEIEAVAATRK